MKILVGISKADDGNMHIANDKTNKDVISNRKAFLTKNNIDINQTTRISTIYEGNNYRRYYEVSDKQKGDGMFDGNVITADALVTKKLNHALFLPIADCVGAVIFDQTKQVLMLSHLGRHAIEQNGGFESVKFLVDNYGCNSSDLLVWLTPAPGADTYPLFAFDNRSLKDVALEQLQSAGILLKNINDNPADTAKDLSYFSHSEFLKGNRPNDGRFAVVAMMKK
jgi:copper oxidase (laccase) domain-containing protein